MKKIVNRDLLSDKYINILKKFGCNLDVLFLIKDKWEEINKKK